MGPITDDKHATHDPTSARADDALTASELEASVGRMAIERSSTGDRVAEVLRTMIIDGTLAPGTPLRETPLARSLGVSRNTFREALRILVTDGLATHYPHRGVTVTQITIAEVSEIFRARRILELRALEDGPSATSEDIARLEEVVSACEDAVARREVQDLTRYDLDFHGHIVGLMRSERLSATFHSALLELRLALAATSRIRDDIGEQMAIQHRQLLSLIEAGKVKQSKAVLTEHLLQSEALVCEIVTNRGAVSRSGV